MQIASETVAALDATEAARRVAARFRSPRWQPPLLPVMAVELMALSQVPRPGLEDFRAVVTRDPLLAARVLQRAQPPVGRPRPPVRCLDQALRALGAPALQRLVFDLALDTRVVQAPGYTEALEGLRVHSVATARAARVVARHVGQPPADCFLAGLLRDVGLLALLVVLSEQPERPCPSADSATLAGARGVVSDQIARAWRLPAPLARGGEPGPLAAVLALADRLVLELGARVGASAPATSGRGTPSTDTLRAALSALQIDRPRWQAIRGDVEAALERL